MAGILDNVDRRTQLAGHNRLELLLFRLGGRQRYGINVFKVQEVVPCPKLTQVPHSHSVVRGIANMRGKTITILDLGRAIGQKGLDDLTNAYVVITEYNRTVQGFLVSGVERIVNMAWEDILPPPKGAGANYMTAVSHVDEELVEIIDVEKVLSEVVEILDTVDASIIEESQADGPGEHHILVADDSAVARNQIKRTLDQLGVDSTVARDGREALEILQNWADEGVAVEQKLDMVISDIEMPEMDGYTLTSRIREDSRLKDLYVILHTSLSGVFNENMVQKVGADQFIPKFNPDDLANAVLGRLRQRGKQVASAS